jgi:hypothetical protein
MTGNDTPSLQDGETAVWLASFRVAFPEITVNPPDNFTIDWTAYRAGMPLARDHNPEALRDKLHWLLAR